MLTLSQVEHQQQQYIARKALNRVQVLQDNQTLSPEEVAKNPLLTEYEKSCLLVAYSYYSKRNGCIYLGKKEN